MFEETFFTIASWSHDPWQLEEKIQSISDTLDYAKSQSVVKINIMPNVR